MNVGKVKQIGWSKGLVIVSFLILLGFILYIKINELTEGPVVFAESFPLALLPLVVGITAIFNVYKRGLIRSTLGTVVFIFGLGSLFWGLATVVWGLYNFLLDVPVPYPSPADIGYSTTPVLWFVGICFLYKAIGIKYQLRTIWGKSVLLFVPFLVLFLTIYVVFYKFYGGSLDTDAKLLELLLTIYYPVSDIFLLSPTLVIAILAWKNLGGTLRKPILVILCSLFFMYLSDMAFAYTISNDTFHNGNIADFLWSITFLLMGLGINSIILPITQRKNFLFPLQYEDIFSHLALKIIQEEEKIIGSKAWELASEVKGLYVDENRTLRIQGNKNEVINQLIAQYEQVFGQTSRELAKDTIKGLSTVANTMAIDAMVTLNISSAVFFIRQASTGNFQSIFPFEESKQHIERHHPIIYYFMSHQNLISRTSIPDLINSVHTIAEANDLKEVDQELFKFQAEVAGGVYSDQELIGLLLLGSKANNEQFTENDFAYLSQLLSSSSRELAIIIHYRNSQASVLRTKQTPS